MNYKVQYVNLETGYTVIQILPTIQKAIDLVNQLMNESLTKYRITITTK